MIGLGWELTTRTSEAGPRAPSTRFAPAKTSSGPIRSSSSTGGTPRITTDMGGRLLASIGFIVSPGMIFTMAGKVDYMSLQPGRPTPTIGSNAKYLQMLCPMRHQQYRKEFRHAAFPWDLHAVVRPPRRPSRAHQRCLSPQIRSAARWEHRSSLRVP